MLQTTQEQQQPVLRRLWTYQAERFPLFKTTLLLAAFTSASINVSAMLANRQLPGWQTYAVALIVAIIFFFQMRACDEWKDGSDDRRYRPERAIPRGLVSLHLILTIAAVLIPIAILATMSLNDSLTLFLIPVWIWLALMTVEFFAPEWLKARPILYLLSHMLIMPLIDLFVTATEWFVADGNAPSGLWLFLLLSFINGSVIEIGRKLYAPENEREGVDTYTSTLGIKSATLTWCACLIASYITLIAVGHTLGHQISFAIIGGSALASTLWAAHQFMTKPTPKRQKRLDTIAGAWVFLCYTTAGFVPIALRFFS